MRAEGAAGPEQAGGGAWGAGLGGEPPGNCSGRVLPGAKKGEGESRSVAAPLPTAPALLPMAAPHSPSPPRPQPEPEASCSCPSPTWKENQRKESVSQEPLPARPPSPHCCCPRKKREASRWGPVSEGEKGEWEERM